MMYTPWLKSVKDFNAEECFDILINQSKFEKKEVIELLESDHIT